MVLRILLLVIAVALVVTISVAIAQAPGTVTINWLGWILETHIGVAILFLFLLMAGSGIAYRVWRGIIRLPRTINRSMHGSKRERGLRALTTGFVAVAAGDGDSAKKLAKRADHLLKDPPLTRLLAAQAAQLQGDEEAAEEYFRAMLNYPETEFLALRGLLNIALKKADTVLAYDYADRARKLKDTTPWVLRTCFELEIKLAKWQAAQTTLSQAIRGGVIDATEGLHFRVALLIERSREAEVNGSTAKALELAHEAARLAPDFHPAAIREARLLSAAGRRQKALKVVEKAYAAHPSLVLAELFADLAPSGSDPADQLRWVKKLADKAPGAAASHLAIAEAELNAKAFGEARRRLSDLEKTGPSRRVYALLARLEQLEHGDNVAAAEWLAKAADAPPAEGWICDSCGTPHDHWSAVCDHCGAFDQFSWRTSGGGRGNPVTILAQATDVTLAPAA